MDKKSLQVRAALVALIMSISTANATESKPHAEVLHWWSSAGESAALQVFIETFISRGGHYYDSTKDDQGASREEAIERMAKGYPSTLTQWNAGWDVKEFYEFGLIDAITDPDLSAKLNQTLPTAILDAVTYDGNIIAMPINIHSENWMWHSNDLINHNSTLLSHGWKEFLNQGKLLSKKGIPLLAVGDQSWQVRILFTSLMLGISRKTYKDFYLSTDAKVADSIEFKKILSVFNQLAKYSNSFGDGSWNTQVKAVANNNAGATFMGDWAKGEFQTLGKTPGKDYGCSLTASDDPSLLLVIDAFILGKVNDPLEKEGQKLMLDVVSDPAVNLQFNTLKGSVSPYNQPSADRIDVCSAQVYNTLSKPDAVIPPYASYGHGSYMDKIDVAIYNFWKASQLSTDNAALVTTATDIFRKILVDRNANPDQTMVNVDE